MGWLKKPGAILKLTAQQSAEEADFVVDFFGLDLWVCFHFHFLFLLLLLTASAELASNLHSETR